MNNLKIIDLSYKYKDFKKLGLKSSQLDLYFKNLLSRNSENIKTDKALSTKQKYKSIDCYIFINSTIKNTHVTFSSGNGNVLYSISLGNLGYSKAYRSNIFTTTDLIFHLNNLIKKYDFNYLGVKLKGFGKNRRVLIKKLSFLKIDIAYIQDISFLPHNGCRAKKRPRK